MPHQILTHSVQMMCVMWLISKHACRQYDERKPYRCFLLPFTIGAISCFPLCSWIFKINNDVLWCTLRDSSIRKPLRDKKRSHPFNEDLKFVFILNQSCWGLSFVIWKFIPQLYNPWVSVEPLSYNITKIQERDGRFEAKWTVATIGILHSSGNLECWEIISVTQNGPCQCVAVYVPQVSGS